MDMNDNQEIRIESLVKVIMSLNDSTLSYWWRGGMPLDRSDLERFFESSDVNRNGHLSFDEFFHLWRKKNSEILTRNTKKYIE